MLQSLVESDASQDPEGGGDVSVGQAALDAELFLKRVGGDVASLEQQFEPRDYLGVPVGDVSQGAFLNLAVLAVGLAQENGGWGVSIGDHIDVHDDVLND